MSARVLFAAHALALLAGCAQGPSNDDALAALQRIADRAAHDRAMAQDSDAGLVAGAEPALAAAHALGIRPVSVVLLDDCVEDEATNAWRCEVNATDANGRLVYGPWLFRKAPAGWTATPAGAP